MIRLYDYSDYRAYLKERFRLDKENESKMSYRYIGKHVGLDSGHLTKILNGDLHLSQKKIEPMMKFLGLESLEKEYFETLVLYNRAKEISEIKMHYEKLLQFKEVNAKVVGAPEYKFYQNWYHAAIYTLLDLNHCDGSLKFIQENLNPSISEKEIEASLELLIELGYIKKLKSGKYTHQEIHISTPKKWNSVAIQNHQMETLDLAKVALDRVPKQHRNFITLTMSLNEETLERVRKITEDYRKKIMVAVEDCKEADSVYQFNAQLFPLSKMKIKAKGREV